MGTMFKAPLGIPVPEYLIKISTPGLPIQTPFSVDPERQETMAPIHPGLTLLWQPWMWFWTLDLGLA